MVEALGIALELIGTPMGILMILLGAFVGLIFGILPGLGASQAMILLLPFTYGMDPHLAILMFVSIMSAASFGGALPAILINTPGTPANVVTTFDGHPMALRGEAVRAIFISGASCIAGAVIGALVLFAVIPVIPIVISAFGAKETFWLVIFGIAMIALASKGNTLKGLAAGAFGLLLAFVGRNYVFPGERFTGGMDFLYDGVPMAALLVGVFAIVPMIMLGARRTVVDESVASAAVVDTKNYGRQARQGVMDVVRRPVVTIRSSLIGVGLGIIPAIGGATSSFISHLVARNLHRDKPGDDDFAPKGVIASETANNGKDGGALMPTLAFGIPGDPNTAVLLGALLMHGVPLGSTLFSYDLDLVMIIVLALVLGQIAVVAMGAAAGPLVTRVTGISTAFLVPVVIVCALIGAYLYRGNVWDLSIVFVAAFVAYGMGLFNYPAISLILGYLLGVEAERTFVQSVTMSQGNYLALFDGWIVWTLIIAMVASFVLVGISGRKRKTDDDAGPFRGGEAVSSLTPARGGSGGSPVHGPGVSPEPSEGATMTQGATSADPAPTEDELVTAENSAKLALRWRLIGVGFATALLLLAAAFLVASMQYEDDMGLFPMIVSCLMLGFLVLVLIGELLPVLRPKVQASGAKTVKPPEGPSVSFSDFKKHVKILIWLIGFIVGTVVIGFLAMPFLIAAYVRSFDPDKWRAGIYVAVFMGVLLVLLGIFSPTQFWPGSLPTILPGLLGGGRLADLF
ncbi:tripartite tricarboxylate transporter permease [Nesterenkonia lutea]|uniref:TctA family transporter n=1 Tax=Nesterenkonia lutea TaxID=272919 RepID=A0ABR9JF58_9MICC|nr:tripartite tricarboxylate transporter permease [Nesterenkonia lutea]MBE1524398.1 TctA family transporter [Nesterenkonia lutea]